MSHATEYCSWVLSRFNGDPAQYPFHIQNAIYRCKAADAAHPDPVLTIVVLTGLVMLIVGVSVYRSYQSLSRERQATLDDFAGDRR